MIFRVDSLSFYIDTFAFEVADISLNLYILLSYGGILFVGVFYLLLYGYTCSTLLYPSVAEFLSFYVSLVPTTHQAGYWKPLFCFPEAAPQLEFVVSPLHTDCNLLPEVTLLCTGAHFHWHMWECIQ